jgi:hypothetical protein
MRRYLLLVAIAALAVTGCPKFKSVAVKTAVAMNEAVKTAAKGAVDVHEAELKALDGAAVAKAKELGCPGETDEVKAACMEAKAAFKDKLAKLDGRWEKSKTALLASAGAAHALAIGVQAYLDGTADKVSVMKLLADAIRLYGTLKAFLADCGVDIPDLTGIL